MAHVTTGFRPADWRPRRWIRRSSPLRWAIPAAALLGAIAIGAAPEASAASTVVTAKTNPSFGTILADSSGMTLYTLTSGGAPVLCSTLCTSFWPPLTVPSGSTVTGPPGVTSLGSMTNVNGDSVTYRGDPLYRYINDHSSSDATGDGVSSFGGIWHVVRVSASTTTTTTKAPVTATTVAPTMATTLPATTPTTTAVAPTASSTPLSSGAAVPLGSPGTGGTPPRGGHSMLLVGAGVATLGLGVALDARRRSRGKA